MTGPRSGHSLLWFGVVGVAAALTHIAVFALLEVTTRLWPEVANALGFGVAFFVSFFGHRGLSFQGTGVPLWASLRRFAVTALGGFATNEMVFVLLLRGVGWPSGLALLAALVVAAGQTYVLSRWWAFRHAA